MNNEAAQALLERAMQAKSQSVANLLIESANRLDETIDPNKAKREWLDQWLQNEYTAMLERSNNA